MSRERRRAFARDRRVTVGLLLVGLGLGCGSGDANDVTRSDRAGADRGTHAPAAQTTSGAAAAPTPGFTSAQGTPSAQPPMAPTAVAERMAPPPSAVLATAVRTREQAADRALPEGTGRNLVLGGCNTCHAATVITQQHKDSAGWDKTVTQMIGWGAPVPKDRSASLVAYLAEHYPAKAAGPPARPVPP